MHLLGGANWWLPRRLDALLPRISIEPPECRATLPATIPGQRADDAVLADEVDALMKERQDDVRDIPG
jgi:RND superfamily putative drug exporter